MSGGKGGSQSTSIDAPTAGFRNDVFNRARAVAAQDYHPITQGTAQADPRFLAGLDRASTYDPSVGAGYQQAMGGLGIGMNGLGQQFDPNSVNQFMSPYQQNVMNTMNQQYGVQNQQALNAVNDQATRAGAFGGSRGAIAQGVALGELGRTQNAQTAQMLNSGYQTAMGQAQNAYGQQQQGYGQLANLGLGGIQGLQNYQQQLGQAGMQGGDYLRQIQQQGMNADYQQLMNQQNWGARNLGLLNGTLQGAPYGQTTTTNNGNNIFSTLLGAGATLGGALLGGPLGAVAGAGVRAAPDWSGYNGGGMT